MPYQITSQQLEQVWQMPELNHYPDRSQKFDFAKSEVIQFLERTLQVNLIDACRAFERLRRHKDILFDPTEKRWMGKQVFTDKFETENAATDSE